MSADAPRLDFLLRRLVLLAGEVRDLLAAGDWEGAMPVQDEFDEAFASLHVVVERGVAHFTPEHVNDLAQLRHVHAENERLTADLHRTAGLELGKVTQVRKVSNAYSPLGMNHQPSPRFVDGSA